MTGPGRPPRGEKTTVVGVRLAESLRDELAAAARKWRVPVATVLRAGGIAFARAAAKKWTKAETLAFLGRHGGAS